MRQRKEAGEDAAAKELRELGPPTATLCLAFVRQLSSMGVGMANRTELVKFLDAVEPQGMEEPTITKTMVEDWVTVCRVSTVRDEGMRMLTLAMRPLPFGANVLDAAKQLDHPALRGVAQAGYKEEEQSEWMEALTK